MGRKITKTAPSPWDLVTLPEEDRVTAIGNMTEKLIEIALVVPEISCRTVRQTERHTHIDVLITIFRHRMWANAQSDGRSAEYRWRPLFNAAKFG